MDSAQNESQVWKKMIFWGVFFFFSFVHYVCQLILKRVKGGGSQSQLTLGERQGMPHHILEGIVCPKNVNSVIYSPTC